MPVACAQDDDIYNWFYPFGRNDLLEVAQFMAHNGQFAWQGEVDRVLPFHLVPSSLPTQGEHIGPDTKWGEEARIWRI